MKQSISQPHSGCAICGRLRLSGAALKSVWTGAMTREVAHAVRKRNADCRQSWLHIWLHAGRDFADRRLANIADAKLRSVQIGRG